jgi:hypothetical protein
MATNDIHSRVCSILMLCILLFVWAGTSVAQEGATCSCPSAIYVEALGQGILYSVNYDYRLTTHIGLRAGFTSWSIPILFFAVGELKFTGFPIMVNYLSGEGTSHLELGIGLIPSIISFQGREIFFGNEINGEGSIVLGTATLGYRSQPLDGGFVFRIGLMPLFTLKKATLTGGLSLGFAF